MEQKEQHRSAEMKKYLQKLGKMKYAVFLAAVGVLILLLPTGQSQKTEPAIALQEALPVEKTLEERIGEILSCVEGAGQVRVLLTVKNDGYVSYQTDTEELSDGDKREVRTETVFGEQEALVNSRSSPQYLGAVVISQGGGSPDVCLKLVKAMCALTGLTSDKITVLKMNG